MNTTALATIQSDEFDTIQRTGRMLAASGYFGATGNETTAIAQMATKILAGREMGFGPFASVNGVHIIQGRPSIGANLMAAAVKGSGRYDYRVREMTNDVCKIEFFQRNGDNPESLGISTFTKEDAKAAGTQNMAKFARNMLFARAMSNGVRWFVPDIFAGNVVYVPEELGADVDEEGNVVDTTYTVAEHAPRPAVSPEKDVSFEQEPDTKPRASDEQKAQLYGLVKEFYGPDEWEDQMIKLTKAVSKGATDNPDNLLAVEVARLIDGVTKKMAGVKVAA
jgi:hypothetical protein